MSTRHHVSFPGPLGFRRLALLGLACLAYALFFAGTWLVRSEGSTDGWLVYAARFTKIALCFAIAYRFRNHLPSTTRLAAVGAVLMSVYLVLSCVDHLAAPGAGPSVGWGLLATLFFGCADAVITLLFAHLFSTYAPKFSSCAIVASFLLTESLFLAFSTLGAQAIWFVQLVLKGAGFSLLLLCVMRKERVTPSDLERPLQFGVALGVPAPERPIQALASGSGWTFQLIVAVVFPFLFGFFAQFMSKPQAHAGLYDTPCEIAAIVTLVALLVYAFVRGASLSFNAMLLAVVALYSTGLLVFPWLYMEGSALAGVFIKCGFTVYNVLLWALLARKSFEDPRRTYLYYGVFLGFANVQYGRVAEAFLLDARAATPLLVSYLSIVFLWLIAICCLVLFLLYSRSESRGRSAHPAAVCVSSAEASAVEVDAFALRLEAFCRTAGLTKREREVLIEAIHGYSMDNIAKKLFISSETVRTHMKSIYHKAAVKGKQELVILIDSLPIGE